MENPRGSGGGVRGIGVSVRRVEPAKLCGDLLAENGGVSERQPDVFIVLGLFLAAFIVLVLHPLNDLFLFDGVTEYIEQVDHDHILIDRLRQRVLHPFVALAADVNEKIAGRDLYHVVRRGLVAVQIDAVV